MCFIKNLINLTRTSTGGVGELANFMHGVFFVVPAGIIYKKLKSRKGALAGCLLGAVIMAVLKYSLQGTTQGNGLTGSIPPVSV